MENIKDAKSDKIEIWDNQKETKACKRVNFYHERDFSD